MDFNRERHFDGRVPHGFAGDCWAGTGYGHVRTSAFLGLEQIRKPVCALHQSDSVGCFSEDLKWPFWWSERV